MSSGAKRRSYGGPKGVVLGSSMGLHDVSRGTMMTHRIQNRFNGSELALKAHNIASVHLSEGRKY